MTKRLFLLCIVIFAVPSIEGATWQWVGANMSFNDPANWAKNSFGGNVNMGSSFQGCQVSFVGKIYTTLEAVQYKMGSKLVMGQGAKLEMPSGTKIIQIPASIPEGPTCNEGYNSNWIGGLTQNTRNDFYCHNNWKLLNSSTKMFSSVTPTMSNIGSLVPCVGDTAIFPAGQSYATYVANSGQFVAVGAIQIGDAEQAAVTRAIVAIPFNPEKLSYFSPTIDFTQVATSATKSYITGTSSANISTAYDSVCVANNQVNVETKTCRCYSTCLPPTFLAELERQVLAVTLNLSTQNAITNTQIRTNNYNFKFNFTNIFDLITIGGQPYPGGKQDSITMIQAAITNNLKLLVPATATATIQAVNFGGNNLELTGNGIYNVVFALQAKQENLLPFNGIYYAATTFWSTSLNALNLQDATFQNMSSVKKIVFESIQTTLLALMVQNLNNTFIEAKSDLNSSPNAIEVANTTLEVGIGKLYLNTPQILSYGPFTVQKFGQQTSSIQQVFAASKYNAQNLQAYLTSKLVGFGSLIEVQNLTVQFFDGTCPTGLETRARRSILTASFLSASFYYQVSCMPTSASNPFGSQACSGISPTFGSVLQSKINLAYIQWLSSAKMILPPCYFYSVGYPDMSIGRDDGCLQNKTNALVALLISGVTTIHNATANITVSSSVASALSQGSQYIASTTECMGYPTYRTSMYGPQGCTPGQNLTCFVPVFIDPLTPTQSPVTISPQAPALPAIISASSSSNGIPIVAVAAGGGGFVIIIIIAVVLKKRKRSAVGSKSNLKKTTSYDRTVVAFENQMYTKPNEEFLPPVKMSGSDVLYDDVSIFSKSFAGMFDCWQ